MTGIDQSHAVDTPGNSGLPLDRCKLCDLLFSKQKPVKKRHKWKMGDKVLHWGVCSAGKIVHDFVSGVNSLPSEEHEVVAVAARNLKNAKDFAESHGISRAYGSYKELAEDSSIDVVYIGTIHPHHYAAAKLMLEAGKHVLCEKPLCVNVEETKSLINIAKSRKLFLMEAIWSRTFPLYEKLRETIKRGDIGEVRHVRASFTRYNVERLNERSREVDLAGGALLDIGLYAVQFAQLVFGEKPVSQTTSGFLLETGVDGEAHITLEYSRKRRAVVNTSFCIYGPSEAIVCGTKGYLRVMEPFWCPEKMVVHINGQPHKEIECKLPPAEGKLNFVNSQGLRYEAMEVRKCIQAGLTECPLLTHEMSLEIAEIVQKAREQLGYKLPQDDKW